MIPNYTIPSKKFDKEKKSTSVKRTKTVIEYKIRPKQKEKYFI